MGDRALVARALGLRALEQHDALGQLAGEILLRDRDLALDLVAPGGEEVDPGLDRELPGALDLDREAPLPADAVVVGVDRVQLGLAPAARAGGLVGDDRAQLLVAVAEDVGLDLDEVADGALGGVAPGVHRRLRVLDVDPWRWRLLRHLGASIR